MTTFWQWFLVVGGVVIFISNFAYAIARLRNYMKYGKRNADTYFTEKVRKISEETAQEKVDIAVHDRQQEFKSLREVISAELKPIVDKIHEIKIMTEHLQHATVTNLKMLLRGMYYNVFEVNGSLCKEEKADWDKWFADYTNLGGNGDVKTMNEHVQRVYLETILITQKEKVTNRKKKATEKIIKEGD